MKKKKKSKSKLNLPLFVSSLCEWDSFHWYVKLVIHWNMFVIPPNNILISLNPIKWKLFFYHVTENRHSVFVTLYYFVDISSMSIEERHFADNWKRKIFDFSALVCWPKRLSLISLIFSFILSLLLRYFLRLNFFFLSSILKNRHWKIKTFTRDSHEKRN